VTSGKRPGRTGKATDPAVIAAAGSLHHRRGWIWTLVATVVGFIVAFAVTASVATRGTAYLLLSLVQLLMLIVFLVSLTIVIVETARLRRHAPAVHQPARAIHRTAHHRVLAHPHDRHRHPVAYAVGWVVLAGLIVGGVVIFPRLVNSVGYLAGAGGRATFAPASYTQECTPARYGLGCSIMTDGVLTVDGHSSAATWPDQVPLNAPFTVREPVWRWGLGSGLINGTGNAIGSFIVCLLFEGIAILALYVAARPWLGQTRLRHRKPATASPWARARH
jgi:hypothetical protein